MESERQPLARVMTSVYERTRVFFVDEMDIVNFEVVPRAGTVMVMSLRSFTVLIALGGAVNVLVSFSFDDDLMEHLFRTFTADIEVPEEDTELYKNESASEIANTILGHCTSDLASSGQKISMSPPVIVREGKSIQRDKNAVFASLCIRTERGEMDVSFVGSRQMFLDAI